MLTTITTQIDIPEGYKFKRIDRMIYKGEYFIENYEATPKSCTSVDFPSDFYG